MPILFAHGKGEEKKESWLTHSVDHLKSEAVAINLIKSAANALELSKVIEVKVWCSAANGSAGAGVLYVTKGLHQPEGPLGDLMHLTMSLLLPTGHKDDLTPHSMYQGKFHLYVSLEDPTAKRNVKRLRPTGLSYRVDYSIEKDSSRERAGYTFVSIPNSGTVNSELTAATPGT